MITHLKTCKIKNGGMDILDEKTRYEQKIRVLEEQQAIDRSKIDNLCAKVESMERQLSVQPAQTIVNNTTNNTANNTINNTVNQNVTVNFYNYDKPRIDTLHLCQDDMMTTDMNRKLIELIYFNKALPENHVLYRPNVKEQRLLVYKNDSWKNVSGDNLGSTFIDIKNVIRLTGEDKINGGDLYKTENDFFKLFPSVQRIIQDFNGGKSIADGTIMEIITENRELVKDTMDHST